MLFALKFRHVPRSRHSPRL